MSLTSRSSRSSKGSRTSKVKEEGVVNKGFEDDTSSNPVGTNEKSFAAALDAENQGPVEAAEGERATWDNGLEFLMSCIAMSVGLGNIWRFPFTAYENGGGAFLIPYIIVLIVIGRPMYFLEMGLGQFTSFSTVKLWSVVPALRGVGWGMLFVSVANLTYYVSLMALTVFYFIASFNKDLPWSVCHPDWEDFCYNSKPSSDNETVNTTGRRSSSELYFVHTVLKEKDQIDDGIGAPDWRLSLCLLVAWITIFLVILRGVKSVGKAAYFLAIFPYVVLIALLIRGCTLPGAGDGILFFITPKWGELLNPLVWYAAVSQAFFSLSVSFGSIGMYSSYNNFKHNIYRDALVVTTLDTFTSLLAGCTIFSIIGNLAHEMNEPDLSKVVKGDTGLAFISYPDAIAKFTWAPQFFAVIFFLMLYTLGIGSSVALVNAVIAVICDQFPKLTQWHVALGVSIASFFAGLLYVTPGGQWMLTLVDYYLITFVVFILAVGEVVGISWVYGMNHFCRDMQFMLERNLSFYWRLCWGIVTPGVMIVILIYSMVKMEPKQYDNKYYPDIAYVFAWIGAAFGALQIPIWMIVSWVKRRDKPALEMIKSSFRHNEKWGPKDPVKKREWIEFKEMKSKEELLKGGNFAKRTLRKFWT